MNFVRTPQALMRSFACVELKPRLDCNGTQTQSVLDHDYREHYVPFLYKFTLAVLCL
jgi:hypothetical protein